MTSMYRQLSAAVFVALAVAGYGAIGVSSAAGSEKVQLTIYNTTKGPLIPSVSNESVFPEIAPREIGPEEEFTYQAEVTAETPRLQIRFTDRDHQEDTLTITVGETPIPLVNYGEKTKLFAFVPYFTESPTIILYRADPETGVSKYGPPPRNILGHPPVPSE